MKVTGQPSEFSRIPTGLMSLDLLLGNQRNNSLGYPLRTITELYGYPGHGKSTLAQFIAGKVSKELGATEVEILDVESSYDTDHLMMNMGGSGYEHTAHLLDMMDKKGIERSHEELLDELVGRLKVDTTGAIIVDSLGAIMSQSEVDNPIGSANWGKRPVVINQFMRKAMLHLRSSTPKIVLVVNHMYPAMGGMGHTTPGGEGKTFAAAIRLQIWKAETFGDGTFVTKIKAEKMRYGGIRPKMVASVVIVPGMGVSPHLTAMIDCVNAGLAERTKAGIIKIKDTSLGRLGTLTKKAAEGKTDVFDAFMELRAKIGTVEGDDDED